MKNSARFLLSLVTLATTLFVTGCERNPPLLQLDGGAFGTRYQILLVDDGVDVAALADGITATLAELDLTFSTWRPDSEISRINAAGAGRDLALSLDLQRVLEEARAVHELSGGALDVALLPLSELWGFQDTSEPIMPSDDAVALALTFSGMEHLALSDDGAVLSKRDARQGLDVSALAKGYAVDRLGALLEAAGAKNYLVEFGGEVLAAGERPGGGPWRVVVEPAGPDLPSLTLALSDQAVATSGDYRNHIVIDGRRLGHVLDPRTGRPAEAGVVAATVIADSAQRADALATAFLVMEESAAFDLADALGIGLRRVTRGDRGLISRNNDAFQERLAPAR